MDTEFDPALDPALDPEISVAIFTPEGNIQQYRYADEIVKRSGTVIGMTIENAVILAVEQVLPGILDDGKCRSQYLKVVHENIALAGAGHWPDINRIFKFARIEVKRYAVRFDKEIETEYLVRRIGDYMQAFTLKEGVRIFGCNIIIATWKASDGPKLFKIDGRGCITGWRACAIGKASSLALKEFDAMDFETISIEDLASMSGQIIYSAHQKNRFKQFRFKMAVIGERTNGVWEFDPPDLYELALSSGEQIPNPAYIDKEDGEDLELEAAVPIEPTENIEVDLTPQNSETDLLISMDSDEIYPIPTNSDFEFVESPESGETLSSDS